MVRARRKSSSIRGPLDPIPPDPIPPWTVWMPLAEELPESCESLPAEWHGELAASRSSEL